MAIAAVLACTGFASTAQEIAQLRKQFADPPADARPMVRWWWFGPAVTKEEIGREIDQMHAGGFGGFELASVYPLTLDDPAKGIQNLRYASPEMVDMLRFAQQHGRQLGMRADLTLGSGWPFGGPHITIDLAAAKLKTVALPLHSPPPKLDAGESLIAVFGAKGTPERWNAATAKRATADGAGVHFDEADRPDVALYFILSHTRQMVKRAAVGGEGYVMDHMSRQSVQTHLRAVGEPLLGAFKDAPPYAIFSDSLEVYGHDWTPALPEEFRKRRGYDLLDHLPELMQGGTPQAEAVRHDWGVTLSDLVSENYLKPMADFATQHGTKFRSQTYGEPAVTLADERFPQLPEGEGPQWRAFSFTRWATSANHIFGNNVSSTETWTWLHSPVFRATPLDMKAEADKHFLEGVNQLIGHGWPYSAPYAQEPGWSLYAAAVFNAHNPWYPVMPQVTRYLQRVSWMMRQGQPANDVAILLPEDDAQAAFQPGHVSVTVEMKKHITPELMESVLNAGYNLDYIDAEAIALRGLHYPVLIVPPTKRMPLTMPGQLQQYAATGGKIIFVGELPSVAPGLIDAAQSADLRREIAALQAHAQHVASFSELQPALRKALPPDLDVSASKGAVGFIHRKLDGGDIYFIANTSSATQSLTMTPRAQRAHAEWWNADDGTETQARTGTTVVLPPYGSRLLVLHDGPAAKLPVEPAMTAASEAPTSLTGWHAEFPGSPGSSSVADHAVSSTDWSTEASTRFYSGEARYRTTFEEKKARKANRVVLRFADGKALPDLQAADKPGSRAWYDAPVRDAAIVLVNGQEAGVLWHPPYEVDITPMLKSGKNQIELRVFNTAMNEMAGRPPVDYTALKAKYGDRFQMQDMDQVKAEPSGIVGPVVVEYRHAK
ncbi:glycosyl hydrolase [Terriglobus sp. RCC_193]|uniref:glycosyl hydrolase n=1 Tax=Terriglobus sp. RCC_193 TaxID=3239218 RepID=UPI003523B58D